MTNFLKKIQYFVLLFVLVRIIIFYSLVNNLPVFSYNDFVGEYQSGNKIVIAGASNTLYNFDYSQIQREFQNYTVLGSTGSEPSGLMVILHKLKRLNLDSNDIVILCLPHSLYSKDKFLPIINGQKLMTKDVVLSSFKFNPIMTLKSLLRISLFNIRDVLSSRTKEAWESHTETILYNSLKDLPIHTDKMYLECFHNSEDKFNINDKYSEFDIEYLNFLKKNIPEFLGAKVYYRFPELPYGDYSVNTKKIFWLETNYPFINEFESSVYSKVLFYNQWYHLNKCGAELNTSNLIKELSFLK